MRNLRTVLGTTVLIATLASCSTVKVADTWRELDSTNLEDKSILVVSKTEDAVVRERFEKDLVAQLNDSGLEAKESYSNYSDLSALKDGGTERARELGKSIMDNGHDVVVLTVLRDVEEYTKTVTTGTTYAVNAYPMYYHRRGYYRSFYGGFGPAYMEGAPYHSVTTNNKKYIMETLVYDLTKPEDEQLLTIITTEVDNPKTLGTTSKDFSKKLGRILSK